MLEAWLGAVACYLTYLGAAVCAVLVMALIAWTLLDSRFGRIVRDLFND